MILTNTRILLIFLLLHSLLSITNNLKSNEKVKIASNKKEKFYYKIKNNSSKLFHSSNILSELLQLGEFKLENSKKYLSPSSKESKIMQSSDYDPNYDYKFNIINQSDINNIFNKYGLDSIFMRTNSLVSDFVFNTSYISGLDEEYYLFTKKLFGNIDAYQLDLELDEFNDLEELKKPILSYETNDYKLITNHLINISGYQIFSYFNSYGSLYDIYMQKVDDLEHVQINPNMFKFDNLVKLFKKDKQYYLDFTVDHYIKLDSKFLNVKVTFTDTNKNQSYILNDNNKVIKNLSGNNIIVKSNEDALVYFYKIIPNDSTIIKIEFNKTESDKVMRLDLINKNLENEVEIFIIKDFGFMECYPIISEKNWEIKNSVGGVITSYFENYYDKLENNLYDEEEEKFIIYIFEKLNEDNIPIFNSSNYDINFQFYDSFLTIGNKFNFEVISKHFGEQKFLLFSKNKSYITYQFMTCQNDKIDFIINNLNWEIFIFDTINKDYNFTQKLNEEETLIHEVISENDSLLAYQFHNSEEKYEGKFNKDYSISSINQIDKNIFLIYFSPVYTETLIQYHIIISKVDDLNNNENFSNPCYLANLMTHNSDNIIIKTFFEESKLTLLYTIIDISEFNINENDKFIFNIISNNLHSLNEFLTFYKPIEFSINKEEVLSINLEEKIEFDFDKKSIFKLNYTNNYDLIEYLIFTFDSEIDFTLYFTDGVKVEEKHFYKSDNNLIEIKLIKSGIYYFKFYNKNSGGDKQKTYFSVYIPSNIEIKKEQTFNFKYFILPLKKTSEKNETLLLYYKFEQLASIIIEIIGPNGNKESYNISKKEGFKNFLCDESGNYKIYFKKNIETNYYLKENNNEIKGIFKLMTTESTFDLDITSKDNIEFEEFTFIRDEEPTLKFKVKPKDKDYIKKISISNIDFSNISEIISIKKDNEENKNLTFQYYTFEKNSEYIVNIRFTKKDENIYILEKVNIIDILDFSSKYIKQISSDISCYSNKYNNIKDEFLIINWKNIKKIRISKNKEPLFLLADIKENESKNITKEFQNINFNKLIKLDIPKPENFNYSLLVMEILEPETLINICTELRKDDERISAGKIFFIILSGLFLVLIIIFIIIKCSKKQKDIDFNKKAQEIPEEKLLSDL